jgi:hypothetical protein
MDFRGSHNLIPEVAAQLSGRSEIDLPTEHRRELPLDRREANEADRMPGLKLDEHVDVAIWGEIVP